MNPKKYVYPPLESIIPFRYRIQKTGWRPSCNGVFSQQNPENISTWWAKLHRWQVEQWSAGWFMTGSWNHGLWISLGRMSALELPNNVNRFWSLLSWCFFATKILKLEWFQIVKLDHFSSRFFFGWTIHDIFRSKKKHPMDDFIEEECLFFSASNRFFLDLPNSEKKTPNKNTTQPPSFPASSWWVALRRLFNLKKVRSLSDANPKHCTIIGKLLQNHHTFCMKFDTPPKMGEFDDPCWNPSKMRHAWQNPSFLGRISNTAFDHICAWYLKWFASGGSSANDPLESHERSPNRPGNAREAEQTLLIWNSSWLHGWKLYNGKHFRP